MVEFISRRLEVLPRFGYTFDESKCMYVWNIHKIFFRTKKRSISMLNTFDACRTSGWPVWRTTCTENIAQAVTWKRQAGGRLLNPMVFTFHLLHDWISLCSLFSEKAISHRLSSRLQVDSRCWSTLCRFRMPCFSSCALGIPSMSFAVALKRCFRNVFHANLWRIVWQMTFWALSGATAEFSSAWMN